MSDNCKKTADDLAFDTLLGFWLSERGPRIGVQIAAEFTKVAHPWELPGIHDSLHDVLMTKELSRGCRDLFDTVICLASLEASEPGRMDAAARGFFVLAALYALPGGRAGSVPGEAVSPIAVAFRLAAEASEVERRWLAGVFDAAYRLIDGLVDPPVGRDDGALALLSLGKSALREVVDGVSDEPVVAWVAEEIDAAWPPGYWLFGRDHLLDSLERLLGERWTTARWQLVRHVLVEPRRW